LFCGTQLIQVNIGSKKSVMDLIYLFFLLIISLVMVVSALGVIFLRSIVHSAISLIVTFLSVAGLFILLNADFVAISQIIIYGVGITIILIFAIMLTGKKSDEKLWIAFAPRTLFAFIISACLFGLISYSCTDGFTKFNNPEILRTRFPSPQVVQTIKTEGTARIIGNALLTNYVLPFELLSLLLLAAILGSVVMAQKGGKNLVNPTTDLELDNEAR